MSIRQLHPLHKWAHCVVQVLFATQAFSCPDLRWLFTYFSTMTIQFSPSCCIPLNKRGELQRWIKKTVDRNSDFYLAAVSQVPGNYVMMRTNWHRSGPDIQEHITGDVTIVRVGPICTAALFDLIYDRMVHRSVWLTSTELVIVLP